ncbi:hypothetical protein PsYK624_124530 [Phanerochaete sordida]|uniref:Uncharacterized protein n=1 Tax=Phanerochaete sordida TaxID=48140 RepID=A0A9P3GMQ3_9APHY|nr:hypothetical protein PsYK624_124530 [Phanerochaete sordida]
MRPFSYCYTKTWFPNLERYLRPFMRPTATMRIQHFQVAYLATPRARRRGKRGSGKQGGETGEISPKWTGRGLFKLRIYTQDDQLLSK